ncbi:hypothetical protein PIIN_11171 [Serendipita indica DSM 11827]|uniref:Uncharacterized protein n=1 Tax=Serendipita indica (strain DSM 11827) TaxID=1109443 RepID=G4U0U6_SERID|nr:hypothetical protein PIIN_11171 [Serendipita indica DSM 11827]
MDKPSANSGFDEHQLWMTVVASVPSAEPVPNSPSRGPNHQLHNARFSQHAFADCGLEESDLNRRRYSLRTLLGSQTWLAGIPVTTAQVEDFVRVFRRGPATCCFCLESGSRQKVLRCAVTHLS